MKPRQPAFMHGAKFRGIQIPKIRRRYERNITSNPFLSVMDGRGFLFFTAGTINFYPGGINNVSDNDRAIGVWNCWKRSI